MNKEELVIKTLDKLGRISEKAYQNKNFEELLEALTCRAKLQYTYNQDYKDDFIDSMVIKTSRLNRMTLNHKKDDKTVLFYDGFGLDVRGLAYIYLKALTELGYKVIYVTESICKASQPVTCGLLDNQVIYFKNKGEKESKKLDRLRDIFSKEEFTYAFFYTSPWDIVGNISFYELKDKCKRFLINLTDQAFWVGRNACDYVLDFRNYGASISYYERGINKDQLLLLPYYPILDNISEFKGFSFNLENKKLIYSGGGLYKTLDSNNTYYMLVEEIINRHDDVIFYYTGSGESRFINELVNKYPNKVYFEKERDDLLEVLKRADLYLNTYPISGALMLQYAAMAGCIPITLKREWDGDANGILLNEESLKETFTNKEDLLEEVDQLLNNPKHKADKVKLLRDSVISEKDFRENLSLILTNPKAIAIKEIKYVDTKLFRKYGFESVDAETIYSIAVNKQCSKLIKHFPLYVIRRLARRITPHD